MKKVSNKKIVAIVVTYNRCKLLEECIEALLNQLYDGLDVLVVDNNSDDGTEDFIKKKYKNNKRIIYKNTHANLGGAGGFNFGMKEAIKLKYNYLWLMDDDTIVKEDSLIKLLDADMELKGKYGFLSSRALWTDGNICRMNRQKIYKNSKLNTYYLSHTYYTTFVSFFIKTDVVKDVGLPIKEFFIWSDDVEYSRRIDQKYNCFVVEDSKVIHKTKDNKGSNIVYDDARMERYRYAYRNEAYIARHYGFKLKVRQFLAVNYRLLAVLLLSKKYKIKKAKIIIGSSLEGMKFNPKVEFVDED